MSLFDAPNYLKATKTPLTDYEAIYELREAWKRIYGQYPSDESMGILYAHSALETGHYKSIWCYNFGNIRLGSGPSDSNKPFTMFRCNEIIKGKEVWYNPPDAGSVFRGYSSAAEGAEDYIKFLSQKKRYVKAWQQLLNGNAKEYSYALHDAGYYTADPERYTSTIVSLVSDFKKIKPPQNLNNSNIKTNPDIKNS